MKEFTTFFVLMFVGVANGGPQWVTDKISTDFAMFVETANWVETNSNSALACPAKDDVAGNWGEVREGFQLSIRLDKAVFTNGEPIYVSMLLRNVTNQPLKFLLFDPKDRELKIVLQNRDGQIIHNKDDILPGMTTEEALARTYSGDVTRLFWTA